MHQHKPGQHEPPTSGLLIAAITKPDAALAGDVTGPEDANTVVAIQHNPVDPALLGVPDAGKVLTWTGTEWQAQVDSDPANGAVLVWGNANLCTSTTPRYLSPGYDDIIALTETTDFRIPRAGTFSQARVHPNTPGVGLESNLTFTLVVNGVDSALVVTMLTNAADGSDLVHSVPVAAGDLIRIRVNKSSAITTSPDDTLYSVLFAA